MNYQLAKQLKDAGFPQPDKETLPFPNVCFVDGCYIPNMEELIKEIGDDFGGLIRRTESNTWFAGKPNDTMPKNNAVGFNSAEEALVNLYCMIHKGN